MGKEIDFKNRDRFIQLGITISVLRKMRGMSQEKLAAEAMMSRSHLSAIEAPNVVGNSVQHCRCLGGRAGGFAQYDGDPR